MKRDDFVIGGEFHTATGKWRCTDIGSRVIVAIRLDAHEITYCGSGESITVTSIDDSWFSGPPFAVAEVVFDEDDLDGCALDPTNLEVRCRDA